MNEVEETIKPFKIFCVKKNNFFPMSLLLQLSVRNLNVRTCVYRRKWYVEMKY